MISVPPLPHKLKWALATSIASNIWLSLPLALVWLGYLFVLSLLSPVYVLASLVAPSVLAAANQPSFLAAVAQGLAFTVMLSVTAAAFGLLVGATQTLVVGRTPPSPWILSSAIAAALGGALIPVLPVHVVLHYLIPDSLTVYLPRDLIAAFIAGFLVLLALVLLVSKVSLSFPKKTLLPMTLLAYVNTGMALVLTNTSILHLLAVYSASGALLGLLAGWLTTR